MKDIYLQPKQEELLHIINRVGSEAPTWVGAGGPRAGGKSRGCRDIMLTRRLHICPGTPGYIVMRRYGKLQDEHIAKFQSERPELQRFYNGSLRQYRFPNGSSISFRAADTTDEIMQFSRGPEVYDLFIDQAEQFTEDELKWLHTPNRWPSAPPGSAKTVLFFNPGGKGSDFQRRVFHLRRFEKEERPTDYHFITMYGWDNYEWFKTETRLSIRDFYALSDTERFELFITQTSEGRKLNSLPEHLRLGELFGSFDKFSNQYFGGVWDEQACTITLDQVNALVKPWWTRWMAQDWAFSEHAAHGWYASGKVGPSEWMEIFGGKCSTSMNVVVKYRELVVKERAEADLANDIVKRTPQEERRLIQRFFLSQDAFGQKAKQHGAHTVGQQFAQTMERAGLPSPEPADQDRLNGWRFMYNCLRQSSLRGSVVEPARALEGPAYFISQDCPATIENIPMAIKDDENPDDVMRVAGVLWEDLTDCDRYALKSMLDPKSRAPKDVRAREEAAKHSDMSTKALAMARFQEQESRRVQLARAPRWRG